MLGKKCFGGGTYRADNVHARDLPRLNRFSPDISPAVLGILGDATAATNITDTGGRLLNIYGE